MVRIYCLQSGEPMHIIGMKGTDNGQFLQPIALSILQMPMGGAGVMAKTVDTPKDENVKSTPVNILVVGDSNNRLQVNNTIYFS